MKQIAIIASTASGKTELSVDVAHKTNSIIVSLDSLSIYKEINISSAKPTQKERGKIIHFGIDEIYPDEQFDVIKFIEIYEKAKHFAKYNNKNIIIVGGTSFYLKMMIDGISNIPHISNNNLEKACFMMEDLSKTYNYLCKIDPKYMEYVKPQDRYRIKKILTLFLETNQTPTEFFKINKPKPVINKDDLKIFEIVRDREILRERIRERTKQMIKNGLIDEVIFLEKKYTRNILPMGAIGIRESLEYLDGRIDKNELEDKITFATNGLAKRQRTFNNGQFDNVLKMSLEDLREETINYFGSDLPTRL